MARLRWGESVARRRSGGGRNGGDGGVGVVEEVVERDRLRIRKSPRFNRQPWWARGKFLSALSMVDSRTCSFDAEAVDGLGGDGSSLAILVKNIPTRKFIVVPLHWYDLGVTYMSPAWWPLFSPGLLIKWMGAFGISLGTWPYPCFLV